jgi:uncharacterized OB-fold protein
MGRAGTGTTTAAAGPRGARPPATLPATADPEAPVGTRIPIVDYLVLEPEPHLRAHECKACGARFFDRRNACAACSADRFAPVDLPTEGEVTAYTIVTFAAPGVDVPFVAATLDCGGTSVQANLVDVPPDPEHVRLGMPVRLTTFSMGPDAEGAEGVGFGFAPIQGATR